MKEPIKLALLGNPNTGKSTVFNALTGLHHHTGNWSGKTVDCAVGYFYEQTTEFALYDLPGIYSLFSHSAEEYEAKRFLCMEQPTLTIVILDATSLERNLCLALQAMELTDNVILCLNLMDEAEKKEIFIDIETLQNELNIPIIPMVARDGKGLSELKKILYEVVSHEIKLSPNKTPLPTILPHTFAYLDEIFKESAPLSLNSPIFQSFLIEEDILFFERLQKETQQSAKQKEILLSAGDVARGMMIAEDTNLLEFQEKRSLLFLQRSHLLAKSVTQKPHHSHHITEVLDTIFLSKWTGIPCILLMLCFIFWFTIAGANGPSDFLMRSFESFGVILHDIFLEANVAPWLHGIMLDGIYLTMSWVIAVMLPPMAIFFPLFTLLEDLGILPRIAFHLDGLFQKANAHGKQALSMCMGFGCNAAGVTACRIIESPREKLIAILTNNFVPCNGRFPTLILIATLFLSASNPVLATGWIFLVIVASVFLTLGVSWLLSHTILKGVPSSFILELPPYRKPKIGQVLIRSLLDRTLFVLARAVVVAIPAGACIWILQNTFFHDQTILYYVAEFLDPLGQLMGLSGTILLAFLLGMPANEIVIPILMMLYANTGVMFEAEGLSEAFVLFSENGWTWLTGLCGIIFALNHFPCTTTLLTIKKETNSNYYTFLAFALPTIVGIVLCCLVNAVGQFFL